MTSAAASAPRSSRTIAAVAAARSRLLASLSSALNSCATRSARYAFGKTVRASPSLRTRRALSN